MSLQGDLGLSLVLALVLSVIVVRARAATRSGVVAGFVHAAWLGIAGGWPVMSAFVALVAGGTAVSRLGRARKEEAGVAQEGGGRRAWQHVVANAGPAALILLWGTSLDHNSRGDAFLATTAISTTAAAAALIGSFCDTAAGEIGMLFPARPRLLLFGPLVARGTDGGMTWAGTSASVALAAVCATMLCFGASLPWLAVFAGGVTGSLVDSVLGATIERRFAVVNNEVVNFFASLAAGLAGGAVAWRLLP